MPEAEGCVEVVALYQDAGKKSTHENGCEANEIVINHDLSA